MKIKKIIELVESVQSFSDVYDAALTIDEAKDITDFPNEKAHYGATAPPLGVG